MHEIYVVTSKRMPLARLDLPFVLLLHPFEGVEAAIVFALACVHFREGSLAFLGDHFVF